MHIKDLRERTGLSQSQFATLLEIPVKTIQRWECGRSKPADYVMTLIEKVLVYEGVLKGDDKMADYTDYGIKPEEEMTVINIKEWQTKYPNKCAIIKPNDDGITAKLVLQSAARAKDSMEQRKEMIFGDSEDYIVI